MLSLGFLEPLRRDRRLAPLLMMIGLIMTGNGIIAPILSLYAQSFGVAATFVGALITVYGVGRLMANLPAGHLSQRYGRRPMLFVGPLIVAFASAMAAMTDNFPMLVVWRLVQGVGSGIYMTASLAAIADISPPAVRAANMALYQAALQFGATIGPGAGGLIAEYLGYAAVFWTYMVVGLAASLTALSSFEDTLDKSEAKKPLPSSVSKRGMMTPAFTSICVLMGVLFFVRVVSMYQLLPQIADGNLHLGVGAIGGALTFCALVNFAILPISPWLIEKFGARGVIAASSAMTVASLVLLQIATNQTWFWIAVLVFGFGGGAAYPAIGAYTIGCLPREKYGPGMGMQRTFGDAGFVLGPLIAGGLDDLTGSHTANIFFNCALMTLATTYFFFASERRARL